MPSLSRKDGLNDARVQVEVHTGPRLPPGLPAPSAALPPHLLTRLIACLQ